MNMDSTSKHHSKNKVQLSGQRKRKPLIKWSPAMNQKKSKSAVKNATKKINNKGMEKSRQLKSDDNCSEDELSEKKIKKRKRAIKDRETTSRLLRSNENYNYGADEIQSKVVIKRKETIEDNADVVDCNSGSADSGDENISSNTKDLQILKNLPPNAVISDNDLIEHDNNENEPERNENRCEDDENEDIGECKSVNMRDPVNQLFGKDFDFGKDSKDESMVELKNGIYCIKRILDSAKSGAQATSHMARRLIDGVFKPEALLRCTFTGQSVRSQGSERLKEKAYPINEDAKNAIIEYSKEKAIEKGWEPQDRKIVEHAMSQRIGEIKRDYRKTFKQK